MDLIIVKVLRLTHNGKLLLLLHFKVMCVNYDYKLHDVTSTVLLLHLLTQNYVNNIKL